MAAAEGYAGAFGDVYQSMAAGEQPSSFAFQVGDIHLNQNEVCHGGAMATFADIAQGRAARGLMLPDQSGAVTVNLSVDYVSAARPGEWVVSAPTILRVTRNLIFTQAIIMAGARIVARSSAIFAVPGGEKR
jgi:uncharacterized protein (TIGR00369 family)